MKLTSFIEKLGDPKTNFYPVTKVTLFTRFSDNADIVAVEYIRPAAKAGEFSQTSTAYLPILEVKEFLEKYIKVSESGNEYYDQRAIENDNVKIEVVSTYNFAYRLNNPSA